MLTLKAFGALDFRDESCASVPALLAQPKRSALLAYLVLAHRGSFCRRDSLLAVFWPELDEAGGRHALSQALSFLRRHLPEGLLTSRGTEEVGVDAARVSSDVQAFEAALAAGAWGEALNHYRGKLLEGLHVAGAAPFTDWVDRERERLREAAAGAAWKHAHALIASGDLVDAERTAQRALHLVPTDESAVRGFIQALAAGGDRAGALRFYEKFAAVLEQELEVEPARETEAVVDAVRNGGVRVTSPLIHRAPASASARPAAFIPTADSEPGPPTTSRSTMCPPLAMRWRIALTAAVVAVLAISALGRTPWSGPRPLTITVTDIRPVSSEAGVEFLPAISPDGRDIAFVSEGHLLIRSADYTPGQGEVDIGRPAPAIALAPIWTADGEHVRFLTCADSESCVWRETGATGGTLRAPNFLPGVPEDVEEMAWSPDGTRVAFLRSDTLFTASTESGARALFAVDVERRRFGDRHSLAWSPDGKRIALVNGSRHWFFIGWEADPSSIWVVDAKDGTAVEVVAAGATNASPVWLDERHLLFISTRDGPRALYVVEVGPRGARGEPTLVPGLTDPHTISYSPAAGRLAFARYRIDLTIRSYPLDSPTPLSIRDGVAVPLGNLNAQEQDVSLDGEWLVHDALYLGQTDIYKRNLTTGEVVRLTDSPRDEWGPRWSPDGREVAFSAVPPAPGPGQLEVFVVGADGGTPTQVSRSSGPEGANYMVIWSPDGLSLGFHARPAGISNSSPWIVSRDSMGGAWHEPVRLTQGHYFWGAWAPDSRAVLLKPLGARYSMDLIALSAAGDTLWTRDIPATTQLQRWAYNMQIEASLDGRTLYSRGVLKDGSEGIWAIPDFGRGEPRLVVAFDDPSEGCFYLSVGPDRLYLTVQRHESDVWVATLKR